MCSMLNVPRTSIDERALDHISLDGLASIWLVAHPGDIYAAKAGSKRKPR